MMGRETAEIAMRRNYSSWEQKELTEGIYKQAPITP